MALTIAAAAVALLFAVLYFRARAVAGPLETRVLAAENEVKALKSRSEVQEYRIERYELLWFPTVTYSPQEKTIMKAAPGVPHCRACVIPLALDRGEFLCRQCGAKHPESLADTVVIDSITQQALKWFRERHPGYPLSKG